MRGCWWHNWTPWKSYVVRYRKSHVSHVGTLSTNVTETRQVRRCVRCFREQHIVVQNGIGATWDGAQDGHCPVSEDAAEAPRPSVN